MQIEDGSGTAYKVSVSSENRLRTVSTVVLNQHHINHQYGDSYSVLVDGVTTSQADACVLYIRNTNDKDIMICSLNAFSNVTTELYLELDTTGTPGATTDNVPANRNAGTGNTADVTCYQGNHITGLTTGTEVERLNIITTLQSLKTRWDSHFIVPKNHTFTVWCSANTCTINLTLSIFFHEVDIH